MNNDLRPRTMAAKVENSACCAAVALSAYRGTGGIDEDDVTAAGDLMADLLHMLNRDGLLDEIDVETLLDRALRHFEYESDPANADEEV